MLVFLSQRSASAEESAEESDLGLVATLRAQLSSGVDQTVYTFTNVSLGPVAADRLIAVGVFGRDASATSVGIVSVSVGGSPLTNSVSIVGNTGGANPQTISALYWGVIPGGETADIVVTFNLSVIRAGIAVWEIPGASATAHDTATANNNNIMAPTIDAVENGCILAISGLGSDGTETATWIGAGEDFDVQVGGEGANYSGASASMLIAESGRTVQVTWTTGTNDDQSLAVVSFAPA